MMNGAKSIKNWGNENGSENGDKNTNKNRSKKYIYIK